MIFKVVVVFFTLQTFSCLGEQAFLSQPDENPMELLEVTSAIQTSKDDIKYVNVTQGVWGNYTDFKFAPRDYVACGVQLRVEKPQDYYSGFWAFKQYNEVDDTSTNAIRLYLCSLSDWYSQYILKLNEGIWGDWYIPLMCNQNMYMYGAVAQVYGPQGEDGDDTAFNGIRILCTDREGRMTNYIEFYGMEGEFTRVNPEFDVLRTQGYKVVGGRVRFEGSNGNKGDDTALNGLELALKRF
jgi:hypothetical protein